ncbi:hypothetical protein JRO89_XS02G0021500 [Xanthoceras sorbifolium]|uniref:Dirigent protein n=1 Tax=Xanthoceras sorbifolium TaxID=99658 RepID=A0ABQ8IEC7_9ROSI|nr:hypothetical protein JRO89_XS02G0021500 [Xanthoceras sorbifolium]
MILCVTFSLVHGKYYSATEPHVRMKEKVTNLYFFFHDTLSGKNPSAVLIAKPSLPNNNDTSQSSFGSLYAVDDPLTVRPELTSEVIGNAQGLWVSSGQGSVQTLVVYFDFGFTTGELNGSAITVFSRNPVMEMERELAVIGGRGRFRMARGFAQLKTYTVDLTNGDAIVEYNVTVIHY